MNATEHLGPRPPLAMALAYAAVGILGLTVLVWAALGLVWSVTAVFLFIGS